MGQLYNSLLLAFGLILLLTRQLVTTSTIISIANHKVEITGVVSIFGAIITIIAAMNYYSKRQIDISLNKNQ